MALNNITNNTIPRLQSSMTLPICQEHRRVRNLPLVGTLPLTSSLVSIISAFVIFPVTLLLNVLMIIAFYKNNPILRKKANIFLGAIAVNDLIRGCIGGPSFIAREIRYQYKLEPNCYLTAVFATVLINAVSELFSNCFELRTVLKREISSLSSHQG